LKAAETFADLVDAALSLFCWM